MEGFGTKKVLLIGWDGADWRVITPLMEKGELPHLEKLVNQGVMGNLGTLQPTFSPLIWNSIATGMFPDKHGIIGFTEVDEETGAVRASTSLSRKVKAVWNILSQKGYRTHVINWFSSHPAEPINGVCISDLFSRQGLRTAEETITLPHGTVHPEAIGNTLTDLWVYPRDIDSQTISLFVPRFTEVDQNNDRRLERIAVMLAECFSVHAAATWVMENRAWDFMAVYYGAIDHFCHGFMRFHPPLLEGVDERDFELYGDVVNSIYRLHDLLLGRLLQLAGEDTFVILCSDHGHYTGDLRPRRLPLIPTGPAEEHRAVGIFAMKGPGIKQDELVHGASVLDITPTVLTLFGLPVGRDMDGRTLADAFEPPLRAVDSIPSWQEVPGPAGMHPPGTRVEPEEMRALLDQFVALGYVEPPQENMAAAARLTHLENKWNLARSYLFSRRFPLALPLLEEIYDESPLRLDFGLTLAECQYRLGLKEEAYEVMTNLAATFPQQARAKMLLGVAEYEYGHPAKALEHLREVERVEPRLPVLFVQLGWVYLRLKRPEDAMHAFQRALAIDSDTAAAHLGMARCLLSLRLYEKAADAALQAVSLEFSLAEGHFCLGVALAQVGETARAIQAFEACLRFQPRRAAAHHLLARLYDKLSDGKEKAEDHRLQERESAEWRSKAKELQKSIKMEVKERAKERQARRDKEARELMEAMSRSDLIPAGASATEAGAMRRPGSSGKEFLIVSGLPRSGTSLMMQILSAAGIPLMTDGKRVADEDNPEGYYEWETVKRLGRNPRIIEEAEGKAIKVISLLLPLLPRAHRYKVIFMRRPVEEIAASQARLLERQAKKGARVDRARLTEFLRQHQENVLTRLKEASQVDLLTVDYPELVANPEEGVKRLHEFLGPEIVKTPEAMTSVVKAQLYRQRAKDLKQS